MSSATRPWGPSAGACCQASSSGPSKPARSCSRSSAGARCAGSSAAVPSRWVMTAEMFSRQEPSSRAAA
eukprot:1655140-Alexandrium_andersonii.AAC.1